MRKLLLFILTCFILSFSGSSSGQNISAHEMFENAKIKVQNKVVFEGDFAFSIVTFPVERRMPELELTKRQLLRTGEVVKDFCLAETLPLKSPFSERLTPILEIRPPFRMPNLECNVVKNEVERGQAIYVTAFNKDDLERLKANYANLPDKYTFEEWVASLRQMVQHVRGDSEKLDGLLALLNFPERILAGKPALVTEASGVNLQELYAAVAAWSPDKNSLFKVKRTLQAAPGFPPALLVLANEQEKQGHHWEAFGIRILGNLALGKKDEIVSLCQRASLNEYGTLWDAYLKKASGKPVIDLSLWKSFGHLQHSSIQDLAVLARQAYEEKRPLEGVAAANQLLHESPDNPDAIALLAEGYLKQGYETLAIGAYWYLLCQNQVSQKASDVASKYLKDKYSFCFK